MIKSLVVSVVLSASVFASAQNVACPGEFESLYYRFLRNMSQWLMTDKNEVAAIDQKLNLDCHEINTRTDLLKTLSCSSSYDQEVITGQSLLNACSLLGTSI